MQSRPPQCFKRRVEICVVKKTNEVEMWTQALSVFICYKQTRKREWVPNICASVSSTHPCAVCLLRKCFCSCQSITFASLPSPKKETHRHTCTKADNSPLGTSGTGKQTAPLCVSPLEFTATDSLLKRSTFIMSWRLESALYLILTRLPLLSTGGTPHSLELSWLTRI